MLLIFECMLVEINWICFFGIGFVVKILILIFMIFNVFSVKMKWFVILIVVWLERWINFKKFDFWFRICCDLIS